jgi:gliding motility-associated-like protein
MKKANTLIILSVLFLSAIIGCTKKQDATCPGYAMYIPNSFSPNGDGRDDNFMPKVAGIVNYNMQIFNNSGSLMYTTTDPNLGWNGTVQGGSGVICQEGIYTFVIKATDECSNQHSYTGNLSLIK